MKCAKPSFEEMEKLLKRLNGSRAYSESTLGDLAINSGAYVFYEDGKPMYVGIVGPHSKQSVRTRVGQHRTGLPSQAPLASLMTIEGLGLGFITRKQLRESYPTQFAEMKQRVQDMEVRAVKIKCCVTLAAFEIYAAVQLETPYNDFCTH